MGEENPGARHITQAPAPIHPLRPSSRPEIDPISRLLSLAAELNHPPAWGYWKQMLEIKLWQAVALSCGIEPRTANGWEAFHEALSEYRDGSLAAFVARKERQPEHVMAEFIESYCERLEIAKNHLSKGKLDPKWLNMGDTNLSGVNLVSFAAWALAMEWEIPEEFAAIAQAPNISPTDRAKKKGTGQNHLELSTRERDTVLRIIAGFVMQGFNATQAAQPYAVAREVQQALQAAGLELSDETIAKWIKEAVALLPTPEKKAK